MGYNHKEEEHREYQIWQGGCVQSWNTMIPMMKIDHRLPPFVATESTLAFAYDSAIRLGILLLIVFFCS